MEQVKSTFAQFFRSVLSVGKYVGEKETGLLGILNETKQEMKEIQDRQNRGTARGNTSACDESFSGNAQRYLNITHQRLERLENQSRSLIDEVKHTRKIAENFSDIELKVWLAIVIKAIFQTLKDHFIGGKHTLVLREGWDVVYQY